LDKEPILLATPFYKTFVSKRKRRGGGVTLGQQSIYGLVLTVILAQASVIAEGLGVFLAIY